MYTICLSICLPVCLCMCDKQTCLYCWRYFNIIRAWIVLTQKKNKFWKQNATLTLLQCVELNYLFISYSILMLLLVLLLFFPSSYHYELFKSNDLFFFFFTNQFFAVRTFLLSFFFFLPHNFIPDSKMFRYGWFFRSQEIYLSRSYLIIKISPWKPPKKRSYFFLRKR